MLSSRGTPTLAEKSVSDFSLSSTKMASAGKSMTFEMISSTSGSDVVEIERRVDHLGDLGDGLQLADATRKLLVDLLAILDSELDLTLPLSLRANRVGHDDAQQSERECPRPDEPEPGERSGRRKRVPDRVGGRNRDRGQNRSAVGDGHGVQGDEHHAHAEVGVVGREHPREHRKTHEIEGQDPEHQAGNRLLPANHARHHDDRADEGAG